MGAYFKESPKICIVALHLTHRKHSSKEILIFMQRILISKGRNDGIWCIIRTGLKTKGEIVMILRSILLSRKSFACRRKHLLLQGWRTRYSYYCSLAFIGNTYHVVVSKVVGLSPAVVNRRAARFLKSRSKFHRSFQRWWRHS